MEPSLKATATPKRDQNVVQVHGAFLSTVGKGKARGSQVAIPALCATYGADTVLSAIRHNVAGLAGAYAPLRLLEVILERQSPRDKVYVQMLDPVAQGVT